MTKIVSFIAGPFTEGNHTWNVCKVLQDDNSVEVEEVFYESFDDAYDDLILLGYGQEIELEDLWLEDCEEEEMEQW